MGLPKFAHPQFELTLPSTGQRLFYRPFLVKEEKVLLIAQQSGGRGEIANAIKQIIQNCIVTPGIDVDTFAPFDLEYFFLKLRAKSVSNTVELSYKDNEDEQVRKFTIDLDAVQMMFTEGHSNIIDLPDNFKIKMKYPDSGSIDKIAEANSEVEGFFWMVRSCIDTLYREGESYKFSEYTDDDVEEFVSSLPVAVLAEVRRYIETMPRMRYEIKYKNNLGNDRSILLQSLDDFFSLG